MSITHSLDVKAEEDDVLKKELEGTQAAFNAYEDAWEVEDPRVKELVDDIKAKQARATDNVRVLRRENERLKKELASHYLAANPRGNIAGFLKAYVAEEQRLLAKREAIVSKQPPSPPIPLSLSPLLLLKLDFYFNL